MKKMDVKAERKGQVIRALAGTQFPMSSPEKLLVAFPGGADVTRERGIGREHDYLTGSSF